MAMPPSWRLFGWPTPQRISRSALNTPAPLPRQGRSRLGRIPEPCPFTHTATLERPKGLGRNCWHPTPAMPCRGWKLRAEDVLALCPLCVRPWKKPSESVSRGSVARCFLSARRWCRPFSMACSSAWVLWSRQTPIPTGKFSWHEAVGYLRVPVIRALFHQLTDPGKLTTPRIWVEVSGLDGSSLGPCRPRARSSANLTKVRLSPTSTSPFLQAFDPDLRKQLGVWYTPVRGGAIHGGPR